MYGWKGKIGLLIFASNITIEPEFYRMIPEGISVHASRIPFKEVSRKALIEMEKGIYRAALLMTSIDFDVILVGCTSGSFVKGFGYDQNLIKRITRLTGVKTITTSTAVIDAMKLLKFKKVAVATPYTDEINEIEKKFIEAHGIAVTRIKGLGYSRPAKAYPLASKIVSGIGLIEPTLTYKLAMDVDSKEADGIFISCTNLRTIEIIEPLERNAGKPVITSNQASLAMALRVMGIREKVKGFGLVLSREDY